MSEYYFNKEYGVLADADGNYVNGFITETVDIRRFFDAFVKKVDSKLAQTISIIFDSSTTDPNVIVGCWLNYTNNRGENVATSAEITVNYSELSFPDTVAVISSALAFQLRTDLLTMTNIENEKGRMYA